MENIIRFAIENEVEAYEFYCDAASKIKDASLKETFEDLASEEAKHKKFLEDFLVSGIEKMSLPEVADYHISESLDDEVKLSTELSFADAIKLAMKKEEEAMHMYQKLSGAAADADQKELFDELAKMEQMHKVRLEDIYTNAAFTEVW